MAAVPVTIVHCDACYNRIALYAAAFVALRGYGFGHFCAACRGILPEEPEP